MLVEFLEDLARRTGLVRTPAGLVAAGAAALAFGTPRGRKLVRSLAVASVAAAMGVAEGARELAENWRRGIEGIVQEARVERERRMNGVTGSAGAEVTP